MFAFELPSCYCVARYARATPHDYANDFYLTRFYFYAQ
uniref:Uncharacterized protein n=1 Tax=Klebsiella phage vB_KpnM_Iguana_ER37 TaxID=3076781 RepID=A0AB38Z3T1_9CAUD